MQGCTKTSFAEFRLIRGLSSAGRASDLHSEGHRFDPGSLQSSVTEHEAVKHWVAASLEN